jgi:putative dehydrogenase
MIGVVGVVGVGSMGLAMVQRLRESGRTVRVCDIDPARAVLAQAAGAEVAETPAALAGCELVIVAVVDGAQTRAVLFGADGLAGALPAGAAVILCPTIAPDDTAFCAAGLETRGIDWLDAPMSGGPERARAGTMSLMVAASDAVFERWRPLLGTLAAHVLRVGSRAGDGARTKLVNNLLAAVNLAGAAEAMALAQRLGLDGATTLAVIERSSGQSWIGSDRLRRALACDGAVQARIALLAKDAALALQMAAGSGVPLDVGHAAARHFAAAAGAGWQDLDDAALLRWLSRPASGGSAP